MKRIFLSRFLVFFLCQFFLNNHLSGQVSQALADQIERADSLYAENDWAEAFALYCTIYNQMPEPSEEKGMVAHNAARSAYRMGNLENAEIWGKNSAELFKLLKLEDKYHIVNGFLANLLDTKGDYQTALGLAENAFHFHSQKNDSSNSAKILNNLALITYHSGNIQKSIELYAEAIAWAGNDNNALKALCYNQLGNIWADDLNDEHKALQYYRNSLQLKLKDAPLHSVSASFNNLGISHKNLGHADSALFYFNRALDFAVKSNRPAAQVNPLINLANLYRNLNKPEESLDAFNRVLELEKYMSVRQTETVHTNLGIAQNNWGNYSRALHHLNIARNTVSDNDLAYIEAQIALAYKGLGDFEKAYEAQLGHSRLKDSLYLDEKNKEIADIMVKYEAVEKDKSIMEQQQLIQQKELQIQRYLLGVGGAVFTVVFISGLFFFLYKRKEAIARQAKLELQLAEQKELTRIQQERLRISRELHDNIGSHLTLLSASVEQLDGGQTGSFGLKVSELQDNISLTMRELRKTVWLLNKNRATVDEIAVRLRDFFKSLNQNGTRILVIADGNTGQTLSDSQTTNLFRVVQEAINNAYKYASSSSVTVKLNAGDTHRFDFKIEDNGKGFDYRLVNSGNGLKNMKSRIKELDGELTITSKPGKGTTIAGSFELQNTKKYV